MKSEKDYINLLRKAIPPPKSNKKPNVEAIYELSAGILANLERVAESLEKIASHLDIFSNAVGTANETDETYPTLEAMFRRRTRA